MFVLTQQWDDQQSHTELAVPCTLLKSIPAAQNVECRMQNASGLEHRARYQGRALSIKMLHAVLHDYKTEITILGLAIRTQTQEQGQVNNAGS